jgi:phosphotransferase system enzyme I (PtsI)
MNLKKGIPASPGVAIGPAFVLDTEEYRIPRRTVDESTVAGEIRKLDAALDASRQELEDLRRGAARRFGPQMAEIFAFHQGFLTDPTLYKSIVALIERDRYSAAYAFGQEMNRRQRELLAVADPYMKERVRDLYDLEKRVLRHILGRQREDITKLTEPVVLVAHDVTAAQAVTLDREHILGFAINVGGATSHMAILARQMNVPTVVGLGNVTTLVSGGETVIIDGTHGIIATDPDAETVERYKAQQQRHRAIEKELLGQRDLPAITQDGVSISLLANIELAEETRHAMDYGAEGIGLYRSEFLFLAGDRLPSEEQQYQVFRSAVRHARGKPIVIRTIDLGADKMSEHLGSNTEHNPVLGLRSLRYCLHHLDMFKTHLRAILRASAEGDVRIMFPMVATLMEMRQARSTLQDVMEDLAEDGLDYRADVPIGMMVETPAAAMLAEAFAKEAAFLSIGTNDLTQYTLAIDRGNERVAYLYAAHNPAVLRLIQMIVRAGIAADTPVSICGEMAGEPIYCQLLLGMGLRTLSMAPQDIPEVKKIVRTTTIKKCESIARAVRRFDEDRQVFNYLRDQMRSVDPEGL